MSTNNLHAETRVVSERCPVVHVRVACDRSRTIAARFAYDQGYLEIMSPSDQHERFKTLLG